MLSEVRAGTFRVKVHYWGAYADDDERGSWTYQRLMERLEQLDQRLRGADASTSERLTAERRRVLAQLDQWASPAAPLPPAPPQPPAPPPPRPPRVGTVAGASGVSLTSGG